MPLQALCGMPSRPGIGVPAGDHRAPMVFLPDNPLSTIFSREAFLQFLNVVWRKSLVQPFVKKIVVDFLMLEDFGPMCLQRFINTSGVVTKIAVFIYDGAYDVRTTFGESS